MMVMSTSFQVSSLYVGEMGDSTGSISVSDGCTASMGQIHTLVEVNYTALRHLSSLFIPFSSDKCEQSMCI